MLEGNRLAHSSGTAHSFSHLLITSERLNAQANGLKLRPHLVELVNISAGSDKVLCHDLASVLNISIRLCSAQSYPGLRVLVGPLSRSS
jgi:hypothetical protein